MGCNLEITQEGRVIEDGVERKLHSRKADGYIVTSINNKLRYVHRLVAEKYLPNPHNLPVINHKDGNTSNNHVDNLEWTTRRKNCEHARLNGLSSPKLQGIKDLTFEEYIEMKKLHKQGITKTKLAELFNRNRRTIYDILEGKRYKDYLRKEENNFVQL
jgi:hypothetical protein